LLFGGLFNQTASSFAGRVSKLDAVDTETTSFEEVFGNFDSTPGAIDELALHTLAPLAEQPELLLASMTSTTGVKD
jgi:hypothetical protein